MKEIKYKTISSLINDNQVNSFLESASLAHKEKIKTPAWFRWKFGHNGFSEPIISCAFDDEKIIGCVAIGILNYYHNGKIIKCGMSYETFVHPKYQGKNIFSNLIKLAEEEAIKLKVDVLANLPNNNSLKGFKNSGWINNNILEYWVKFINPIKILLNFKSLKTGFEPIESNFDSLINGKYDFSSLKYNNDRAFSMLVNEEYLKWRFFTHPNHHYIIINDSTRFVIARKGKRGHLIEVQILHIQSLEKKISIKKIVNEFKEKTSFDIISYQLSRNNTIKNALLRNFFIKVPNSANFCYKIINDDFDLNFDDLSVTTLIAHTY